MHFRVKFSHKHETCYTRIYSLNSLTGIVEKPCSKTDIVVSQNQKAGKGTDADSQTTVYASSVLSKDPTWSTAG